jgi:hypothetical protein
MLPTEYFFGVNLLFDVCRSFIIMLQITFKEIRMFLRCWICIISLLILVPFLGCIQSTPVMPDIDAPDPSSEVIGAVDQFISEICQMGIDSGTLSESENPDSGYDGSD